jgi:flagellar basal-body rod protein FlgF
MDRLIYTAVSGMSASMIRQRMIASNMANAQTIGFRAEIMESTPVTIDGQQLEIRALNRSEVKGALMREGTMVQTGRPLDIALQGDTMLAVQAPDGGEGYTRRGDLSISATGVFQNGDGLTVMGDNGPVTVPLGSNVSISPDGAVLAANPAAPDDPPIQVAKLKIANWRGSKIEKDLANLFRVPGGGVLPADENAKLMTGTLEQSNVAPTEVLVEMVEQQRLFDIRAKMISTARDLDEGGASLMRITS